MNRTIFLSTAAAIAAALAQPVEAKDNKGGGRDGGGKGGGGGGGKHQAVAKAQAPRTAARSPGRSFRAPAAPRVQSPSVRNRAIVQQQRNVRPQVRPQARRNPSIAFGGSVRNSDRRTNVRNINQFNNNRTVVRNDFRRDRYNRPPVNIYRNWDRRHVHQWNNNRYRWYNNSWVILGGGYAPYYYGSRAYYDSYDYTPTVAAEFSPTSNLALEVQQELGRRGYDTGGVDGVIGPQTRNAIAAFQSDNGLAVTGRIDQSLLSQLGI